MIRINMIPLNGKWFHGGKFRKLFRQFQPPVPVFHIKPWLHAVGCRLLRRHFCGMSRIRIHTYPYGIGFHQHLAPAASDKKIPHAEKSPEIIGEGADLDLLPQPGIPQHVDLPPAQKPCPVPFVQSVDSQAQRL